MLKKLQWYVARLRVMNPREIGARIQVTAFLGYLFLCYALRVSRKVAPAKKNYAFTASRESCFAHLIPFHALEYFEAPGGFDIAASPCRLSFETYNWHAEHRSQREWPKKFFGLIDFRENNPVGDVRTTWETSRLQMLVTAALHYRSARPEDRQIYADHIIATFLSWERENPYLCGVNYISAMECALRIVSISVSFDIIRADVPDEVWTRVANLVTQHANLVYHRISRFSSAGNHTVSEAGGLVFAGLLFREHADAARWRERGLQALEHELPRQILEDGGGLEQASGYLKLITEMGLLTNVLLQSQQRTFSAATLDKLHAAQHFLAVLHYSDNDLFLFGDADDSYALSPYLAFIRPARAAAAQSAQGSVDDWQLHRFPAAGLTSLDWQLRSGDRVQLLFHHHNLGMPPLFAHGHAAALALQLAVNGREILLDCGTFAYNSGGGWRQYLRGTRAHNTVAVQSADQSTQLSNFQWAHDVTVQLLEPGREIQDGVLGLLAMHDGYRKYGVLHYRAVLINRRGELIIQDQLVRDSTAIAAENAAPGELRATAELNWHVAGSCSEKFGKFQLGSADCDLWLDFPCNTDDTRIYYKSTSPLAGWLSRHYGDLEGAYTVCKPMEGKLPISVTTRIALDGAVTQDSTATHSHNNQWWQHPLNELTKSI